MLLLEAEMCFELHAVNGAASELSAEHIIRPNLNFGNQMLFSGTIKPDRRITAFRIGEVYSVIIELPTIEAEAYEEIRPLIKEQSRFLIQLASKVVGEGRIKSYIYE